MTRVFPLSEARKNLSELVNEAFYEGRIFGIAKDKKPMGAFIGAREWKEIIRIIEEHDPGFADSLAIMADPDLRALLDEGERNIQKGNVVSWKQVIDELQNED